MSDPVEDDEAPAPSSKWGPWVERSVEVQVRALLKACRIVFLSAPRYYGKSALLSRVGVSSTPLSLRDPEALRSHLSKRAGEGASLSVHEAIHVLARLSTSMPATLHVTDGQSMSVLDGGEEAAYARRDVFGQLLAAFDDPDIRARVRLVVTSLVPFAHLGESYWAARLPEQSLEAFSPVETRALAHLFGLDLTEGEVGALRRQVDGHPYLTKLVLQAARGQDLKVVLAEASHDNGPLAPFFRAVREWLREPQLLRGAKGAVHGEQPAEATMFVLEAYGLVRRGVGMVPYQAVADWLERL